jgi:hypothetical protein
MRAARRGRSARFSSRATDASVTIHSGRATSAAAIASISAQHERTHADALHAANRTTPRSAARPESGRRPARWQSSSAERLAGVSCHATATATAAALSATDPRAIGDHSIPAAISTSPVSSHVARYTAVKIATARRRRDRRLPAATWRITGSAVGSIIATTISIHIATGPPAVPTAGE